MPAPPQLFVRLGREAILDADRAIRRAARDVEARSIERRLRVAIVVEHRDDDLQVALWLDEAAHHAERTVIAADAGFPGDYLLAARYGRHPSEVASLVVVSTLFSLVTLPLVLIWVL